MKKIIILMASLLIVFGFTFSTAAYPNYNMSWDFRIFDDPDARQVAINTAEKQDGLVESTQDSIDRFKEGLERRLYGSIQSQIIEEIESGEIEKKEWQTGDLKIEIIGTSSEDVSVRITDTITGETTTIHYSNYNVIQ
jgi:curli production assembly/transport component CsgF